MAVSGKELAAIVVRMAAEKDTAATDRRKLMEEEGKRVLRPMLEYSEHLARIYDANSASRIVTCGISTKENPDSFILVAKFGKKTAKSFSIKAVYQTGEDWFAFEGLDESQENKVIQAGGASRPPRYIGVIPDAPVPPKFVVRLEGMDALMQVLHNKVTGFLV